MSPMPVLEPLSKSHRSWFFYLLAGIFCLSLPFLFLYANGYRFTWHQGEFIGTGGIYVAVDRTGASIYIDDELVRETRVFRTAFYAQSLEPGTHRVYVQKEGHHTWVKQLPVYAHLVTEAEAFNMPITPDVRVISKWRTATGETFLTATSTLNASTSNSFVVDKVVNQTGLVEDTEYLQILDLFSDTLATSTPSVFRRVTTVFNGDQQSTSTIEYRATSTKESGGVKLSYSDGQVYAEYVGGRESMPYYYCAEDFELLSSSTSPVPEGIVERLPAALPLSKDDNLMQPVQQIASDSVCKPTIMMDLIGQQVLSFDFFPGSTDLVLLALEDGLYVTEIDNRGWQNSQRLVAGEDLDMRVENGNVYLYDGELIYQLLIER